MDCLTKLPLNFPSVKPVEVKFSSFDLSADAGLLLLRQAEEKTQVCQGLANCLIDNREQKKVKHSLLRLLRQRIYQIAAGYEDANDSNNLRHDPIFKIVCDKIPKTGEELLASQPTMSRWENQITSKEIKALRNFFIEEFINNYKAQDKMPERMVLDIDGWDAETHGNQQLSFFNGYYEQDMYFPVLVNEAESGYPLLLQLRAGNSHPGKGVTGLLRWLFWRLKKALPEVEIILRADGGFALPEILNTCERSQIKYAFGFSNNAVLKRKINYLLDQARLQYYRTQQKSRLFDDVYYAAQTWKQPRRIIMKAEWLPLGANPRFIVTNLSGEPQELYDNFYVQRGATSEHPIKELKLGIKADRLSCEKFMANQFRLFLSQAAYLLMLKIRQAAQGTQLEKAQVPRLRETVIKIVAKVSISVSQVLVELATHCPFAREIYLIAERLSQSSSVIFQ